LKLNRWELLAASQALSIYVLIRLDEGETEDNNFDFLMCSAVTVYFFSVWVMDQLSLQNAGHIHQIQILRDRDDVHPPRHRAVRLESRAGRLQSADELE
jgi:hypothetical protein